MKSLLLIFLFLSTISYSQIKSFTFNSIGSSTFSVLRMENCVNECKKITCNTFSIEIRIDEVEVSEYDPEQILNVVGEVIFTDLTSKVKTTYTIKNIEDKNTLWYDDGSYSGRGLKLDVSKKLITTWEIGSYVQTKYFLK